MKRSKFARRHYVAIADVLAREVAPVINQDAFDTVVLELIRLFKADNPQFKPDYFRDYIGKKTFHLPKAAE